MHITLEPSVTSGNDVLSVRELAKSFDGMTLFTDLNFEVKRGERIAIIGNNGTGKTTILKMINGLLTPDNGEITVGFQRCISVTTIRNTRFCTWTRRSLTSCRTPTRI
ncbi:MAG: ATP-binding cassette domain-containing protein [Clostridium fessum]